MIAKLASFFITATLILFTWGCDQCLRTDCINGGECQHGECLCADGVDRSVCEEAECLYERPCQNGGECKFGICQCDSMHIGMYCETNILDEYMKSYYLYSACFSSSKLFNFYEAPGATVLSVDDGYLGITYTIHFTSHNDFNIPRQLVYNDNGKAHSVTGSGYITSGTLTMDIKYEPEGSSTLNCNLLN